MLTSIRPQIALFGSKAGTWRVGLGSVILWRYFYSLYLFSYPFFWSQLPMASLHAVSGTMTPHCSTICCCHCPSPTARLGLWARLGAEKHARLVQPLMLEEAQHLWCRVWPFPFHLLEDVSLFALPVYQTHFHTGLFPGAFLWSCQHCWPGWWQSLGAPPEGMAVSRFTNCVPRAVWRYFWRGCFSAPILTRCQISLQLLSHSISVPVT